MMKRAKKIFWFILALVLCLFFVSLVVGTIKGTIYKSDIQASCLKYGWPESDTEVRSGLFMGDGYCIRRGVMGETIVRPFSWVKAHCNELGECQE